MDKRLATAVLLLLLVVLQAQLWFGRGSVPKVAELQRQVDAQQARNAQARQGNEQLAAEVRDLREGLDMVEEKARAELGMIRPNELLVQYTHTR